MPACCSHTHWALERGHLEVNDSIALQGTLYIHQIQYDMELRVGDVDLVVYCSTHAGNSVPQSVLCSWPD